MTTHDLTRILDQLRLDREQREQALDICNQVQAEVSRARELREWSRGLRTSGRIRAEA